MHRDPSDDPKRRLLEAVANEPSPTRRSVRMRNAMLMISAIVIPILIWLEAGGMRARPRPLWFVLGTAAGWAVVAGWALWGAMSRGPTMLGPGRRWLRTTIVAMPSVLFVWMLAWDFIDGDRMVQWYDLAGHWRWGEKCLKLTLTMGAWPLLALLLMRRGSDPVHPGITGAAIGAAVGAGAGVFIDMWCPISDPGHILGGHIAPLMILAAIGLLVGRWLLNVRVR